MENTQNLSIEVTQRNRGIGNSPNSDTDYLSKLDDYLVSCHDCLSCVFKFSKENWPCCFCVNFNQWYDGD